MTATVISLAEVRRLRKVGKFPTPERDEELDRIGAEVLQEMARIILGHPPGPAWERAVTPPGEAG